MTSLRVDLCQDFAKVGELGAGEFAAVVRNLEFGEWALSTPLSGIDIGGRAVESVDSVIVRDQDQDKRIVFAGRVRRPFGAGPDTGSVVRRTNQGDYVTISGVDLFGILGYRHVFPTPTTEAPWSADYQVRTGNGSTVIAGYVTAAFGPSAPVKFREPRISVASDGSGLSSTWSGRLQRLDEFVGRIGRDSGVTVRASMPTVGEVLFTVGAPVDRSASKILSDRGDLVESTRTVGPEQATYVIGAGQGELAARQFATADSGATGWDAVHRLYENTNIESQASLQRAATSELAKLSGTLSVDAKLADAAAETLTYGVDYEIGDSIGVDIDSVRYSAVVESVTIRSSSDGDRISPVLGRKTTDDYRAIQRDVADLFERFGAQVK